MDKSTRYKIFNDPVHGFITLPKGIIMRLVDHPYVQRLRRIRQMGLAFLVFPSAEHSRFSHALGALELMQRVLNNLRVKDTTISRKEYESAQIAILLHDIGHGPLSHTLEHTLIGGVDHEQITLEVMKKLNQEFNGELEMAIEIFNGEYEKPFLHQLVSSQLDMDRLDYLKRDSFFTGVSEGSVGIDRIIKTMRVFKGHVVIEQKGIYAVENYILSRRLMYMQVYLHKTVLSGDRMLRNVFKRVRKLLDGGKRVHIPSPALKFFLEKQPSARKGISPSVLSHYLMLDDNDIYQCLKYWQTAEDPILADLSRRFLNRSLFRTSFLKKNPEAALKEELVQRTKSALQKQDLPSDDEAVEYYLAFDESYSEAYQYKNNSIWILENNGEAVEFSKAADTQNIIALTEPVVKPYAVHLKEIESPYK